ncbi:MAG TPA: tetratricopeptide repeat protein [Alphaproteobacteria bacterium]|nr:tetratricopeptide repeat protein [Alphaproteobacteria bacterium]
MNPAVLSRFIKYMFIAILVTVGVYFILPGFVERAPGDYYTEQGDILLRDRKFAEALKKFDEALKERPDHRGALMGRALVYIQTKKHNKAVIELTYLIDYLNRTLKSDDRTGKGVLAAAYANRGIVHDREARYKKAFDDYILSLKTDEGVVSGPDVVHKILYGNSRPSTVRKRARYIAEQLKLPPDKRVLRIPEIDKKQRMYKP